MALYIFDLEGTTGIYNKGAVPHINNTTRLRPGFREMIAAFGEKKVPCAIATRAPRKFTEEILANLREQGISWAGAVYTKEDVQIEDLLPYKDLSKIYTRFDISSPAREVVVLGDLLRIKPGDCYTKDDFMRFDFQRNPEVLSSNFSLNDHPLPHQEESPVYAVLPQPWTTFDEKGNPISLDMSYVIDQLENMYKFGGEDFSHGFERMLQLCRYGDPLIIDNRLAQKRLKTEHYQKYFIMRGEEKNWKPLEVLF